MVKTVYWTAVKSLYNDSAVQLQQLVTAVQLESSVLVVSYSSELQRDSLRS
jgi:hypothetical protein